MGGHAKLPMKELVAELEKLGLSHVRTYIQSGNAVFRSPKTSPSPLSDRIANAVESSHGFRPRVLTLSLKDFRAAVAASPFPKTEAQAKTVHLYFLAESPKNPNLATMDTAKAADEEYSLKKKVLYLHAPSGFGKSRLAARVERSLGVAATARNWRSVNAILEIAEEVHRGTALRPEGA